MSPAAPPTSTTTTDSPKSILVVGAGAIGAMLGGVVAERIPNARVVLMARGAHYQKMKEQGGIKLLLDSKDSSKRPWTLFSSKVQVINSLAQLIDPSHAHHAHAYFDFVLLTVKAHQLADVANNDIKHWSAIIGPNTSIITLQNGLPWHMFLNQTTGPFAGRRISCLDPTMVLERTFPASQIVAGVALPAAEIKAPGEIEHHNGWKFNFGPGHRASELSAILQQAGFEAPINHHSFTEEIWVKLLGSAVFNPVSALTGATLREIGEYLPEFCLETMKEIRAVALSSGCDIRISNEKRLQGAKRVGDHKTSMLMDMEARRQMEIDALVTSVLEVASWTKLPMPSLSLIHQLIVAKQKVLCKL